MADKVVFLSHIHEERELAGHIKSAIENEFSGFVDVFVSSDRVSIPAGSNFLRRIENGLVDCIGAIYLISPKSVNRNWINFELGAVWIRNAISQRSGGTEIPAIPMCHSGIEPSGLPSPINNLNAVRANEAAGLQFALASLQTAVGGRGNLKTDIDALIAKVLKFEQYYTIDANIGIALEAIGIDQIQITAMRTRMHAALALPNRPEYVEFNKVLVQSHSASVLHGLAGGALKNILLVESRGFGTGDQNGQNISGSIVDVKFLFTAFASALKM